MKIGLRCAFSELDEALRFALPMLLAPCEFVDPEVAELVVIDDLDGAEELVADRYVVHYCMGGACGLPADHPSALRNHERFQLVLDEEGAGVAVAARCIMQIAILTKSADLVY